LCKKRKINPILWHKLAKIDKSLMICNVMYLLS
jgi:hypothetical protein